MTLCERRLRSRGYAYLVHALLTIAIYSQLIIAVNVMDDNEQLDVIASHKMKSLFSTCIYM